MQKYFEEWDASYLTQRIWSCDAHVWTNSQLPFNSLSSLCGERGGERGDDPSQWLGWLNAPQKLLEQAQELKDFAQHLSSNSFTDAVILGMGGSSLCSLVFAENYPVKEGFLRLHILDSISPSQIATLESKLDLRKTIFIVASKSGATLEVDLLRKYFFSKAPSQNFIAITDPRTPLEKLALEHEYRKIFYGIPEVGGRYSALTNFGIVPASLMGIDTASILIQAKDMMHRCAPSMPAHENPGVVLGIKMGLQILAGNHLFGINPKPFGESFALWQQQLLAESLGKDGKGIFCYVDSHAEKLSTSQYGLGGEFYRWQFATAVAASFIGVNPFNQPDVEATKKATKKILSPDPFNHTRESWHQVEADKSWIPAFASMTNTIDFISILAFVNNDSKNIEALESLKLTIANITGKTTSVEFGPRYLHSTGQFYKGGVNRGLFLVLIENSINDLCIPDSSYTFNEVLRAQANADAATMYELGRAILTINLEGDTITSINSLKEALDDYLETKSRASMYASV